MSVYSKGGLLTFTQILVQMPEYMSYSEIECEIKNAW